MKKMSMLLTTFAVLGLATVAVWAGNSDKAQVGFSLEQYFSLEVKNGANVEFGTVDALAGPYEQKHGSALKVDSNTSWNISTSKAVLTSPNGANADTVLNALAVSLETESGTGKDADIKVDYTLDNLEDLPTGDYVVEVTFTGSTK